MNISFKTTAGYDFHAGAGTHPMATRSFSQDSKANRASEDMEALFIQNMLKEMRASIPKGGLVSGGKAEEMFTTMLDAEMAKSFSASGGIGLSSMVQRQLEEIPGKKQCKSFEIVCHTCNTPSAEESIVSKVQSKRNNAKVSDDKR